MEVVSLRSERIVAPDANPTRSILFLHGILGTGANLRTLAKRFVAVRPEWQGVLFDLRAHGASLGRAGPDTIEAAAEDVAAAARALSLPASAVAAHSFGGKVALQLVTKLPLDDVTLIDSGPGTRVDHRGSELTFQVLDLLDTLEGQTWASRDEFVRALTSQGQDRGVALWLAMNIVPDQGRYRFALDLSRIHTLLDSYLALDAWPVLERPAGPRFHLIIGERSGVYDEQERSRARALEAQSQGRITVDVLPAGHWVHVDDFEGLLKIMLARVT